MPEHLVLTLRLRRTESVPAGDVEQPDGTRVAFEGWLQLLELVTRAIAAENSGGATPSPR